jgi:Penicillin-insensitive murein endopeptidase/Zinc carboxypeptidase
VVLPALILAVALLGGSPADPPSRSLGVYWDGRLANGVQLPAEGDTYFTWDPVRKRAPNRDWRRVGSDRLVRVLLRVLDEYAEAHPDAPRVGIGDLSRPQGGDFGPQFGGLGHVSHQNGLDVDVYYPRRDSRERAPRRVGQVDRALAQDLVDRFVRAGARRVFVGLNVRLRGPSPVVQRLHRHDDHLHVRLPLTTTRPWTNPVAGHRLRLPTGWRASANPKDGSTVVVAAGARLQLFDYGAVAARETQRAGAPLDLSPAARFEGFGIAQTAIFRVGSHTFQAFAKLSPASERAQEQIVALLESVRLTAFGRTAANVHSSRLLGRSHEGRPIRLFRIGNPRSPRRLLVVGTVHGDEPAGMAVTRQLVNLLRPVALDLWVVKNLNPDGLAARTRGNARGVDLNRDFDTFSQRETRIARRLIERIRPDVSIWFHQPQAVVRAWGASRATARRYARLADEPYRSLVWPPGSASRWQNGLGQTSFVVELAPGPLSTADAARHVRAILKLGS